MVGAIVSWVRGACTKVPDAAYGSPPDDFGGVLDGSALYECASAGSLGKRIAQNESRR